MIVFRLHLPGEFLGRTTLPRAYLGLGSNMGVRSENLDRARRLLSEADGVTVIMMSSYHETEPVGGPPQEKFLNAAMEIETELSPTELMRTCLGIEAAMGRRRGVRWGPRIIDIDILMYDGEVVRSEGLEVPHPLMHRRLFVLEPLAEIAPGAVHPTTGKTVAKLLHELKSENRDETQTH